MATGTHYFTPGNWPSLLGIGLIRLLSWLPLPVIAFLGKVVGSLLFYSMRSRREIAITNISLCFPDQDAAYARATALRCFQLIAQTTLGIGVNWWASPDRLQRLVQFEGKEHFELALQQKRNIILLAPHAIALEIAGLLLSLERPMITMYQKTRRPFFNDYVRNKRGRFGGLLFERRAPMRKLLKLIRQGNPFYYLPDQDAGDKGLFVPFFNTPAATYPVLSKFADMSDALVLPCYTHILPSGKGWRVVIKPPLQQFPTGDELVDTARMNAEVEAMIRTGPEQYFWVHKRFKTRPDAEPSVY